MLKEAAIILKIMHKAYFIPPPPSCLFYSQKWVNCYNISFCQWYVPFNIYFSFESFNYRTNIFIGLSIGIMSIEISVIVALFLIDVIP